MSGSTVKHGRRGVESLLRVATPDVGVIQKLGLDLHGLFWRGHSCRLEQDLEVVHVPFAQGPQLHRNEVLAGGDGNAQPGQVDLSRFLILLVRHDGDSTGGDPVGLDPVLVCDSLGGLVEQVWLLPDFGVDVAGERRESYSNAMAVPPTT